MPTLTIQLPGLPPVDHILREEMMTIGRMKGNTIALDDVSVSVSHAKITRKGTEFFLKDLNSTNGTMLNGQSINEARLKDGDQLKFGEVIAHYRSEPDFVSTAPTQNTAAAPAPSPAAALVPQPAPPPVAASTTFVSKRLVTQASQMSQTSAAPGQPAQTTQTTQVRRDGKKSPAWLLPAVAGGAVLVVVTLIGVKFFSGGDTTPKTPVSANPPANPAPAKNPAPNNPPGSAAVKPVVPSKNPAAAPAENPSLASLKKALKAADPAERRRAAAALHALGSGAKEAVPELRNALNDADADVRMWSALALVNNKSYDRGEIPILIQVLHHDNSMLRQVSCLSLALIPYEDADKDTVVAALTDTANKDEEDDVRNAAVSALKIIAPESVPAGK